MGDQRNSLWAPENTEEAAQHNLQFEVAIGEAVIEVYRVENGQFGQAKNWWT